MREVWGWDFGDLSTVTVHVRRLRGKVEDDPGRPRYIQTVWGIGYRFDPSRATRADRCTTPCSSPCSPFSEPPLPGCSAPVPCGCCAGAR